MNRFKFLLLFIPIFLLSYDEPSAFGAGDLDSANPYGLTKSEKHIYSNKKLLEKITAKLKAQDDKLRKEFYKLKSKLTKVENNLDGLKSIVDGESNTRVKKDKKYKKYIKMIEFMQTDINTLKKSLQSSQNTNKNILDNYTIALKELSSIIDNINSSYISKTELENFKKEVLSQLKAQSKNSEKNVALSKSKAQILKDAKNLYKSENYSEARYRFEYTASKNYKPAESNYYLGEISYYSKEYKNAPVYYKKSFKLYKKASYMPTLLLHIAISYDKTNKKKSAIKFYKALIKSYPNTKSAKIASSNLKKLKGK
jgi:TolA-binding protein